MSSHVDHGITFPRLVLERMPPGVAMGSAGWLVVVAVLGPAVSGSLSWSLLPAGLLLAYALVCDARFATRARHTIAVGTAVFLVAAVALTSIGAVVVGSSGYEPEWLALGTEVVALGIVVGLAAGGVVLMRTAARGAGLVVAAAVPLGLALDHVLAQRALTGFFLTGAGYYVGMLLLGLALIRLGGAGNARRNAS